MYFFPKIVHGFCWVLGKTIFRFFFHFKVEGEENLKKLKGPLIVAFNHSSWLDPLFINASFPPCSKAVPIHFATWYKHYQRFRPFTTIAGAFPIRKGIGLEKTLKRGLEILKKGGTVGIAPEEKRRRLGRPRKGRRGAAFLAIKTKTPILPIYIEGGMGLKTLESALRKLKKNKVEIKIGKLFYLPHQLSGEEPGLTKLSNLIMGKIYQLKDV